ncbi:hypothetical protein RFC90_002005 [Klebsiella aerogenes]|nr:hypothetical protein [Klebsiella aerogenes]
MEFDKSEKFMNDAAIKKLTGNIKTIISDPLVGYGFSGIQCDMTPFESIAKELNKRDKDFQLDKYSCKLIYLDAAREFKKKNGDQQSLSELSIAQKDELASYILGHYLATPLKYDVIVPLEWLKPLGYHKVGTAVTISEGKRLIFSLLPDNYESYVEIKISMWGFFSYDTEKLFLKETLQTLSILMFMLKQNGVVYSSRAYDKIPSALDVLSDKHKKFLSVDARLLCEKYDYFNSYLSFPISVSKYINELALTEDFSLLKTDAANDMVRVALTVATELLDNNSDEATRVKSAIGWFIQAEINEDDTMSFIQVCMGLESIFGDNESEGGLTNSLADRCAYLIGRNISERKQIKDEFKEMYRVRSKIVHGVKNHLTQNEEHVRNRAFYYLRKSILKEIRNLRDLPERKL